MKPVLKEILVPFVSAIAGGLIVFSGLKLSPSFGSRSHEKQMKLDVERPLFQDLFNQQEQMKNHFDRFLNDDFFQSGHRLDSWLSDKFGGAQINSISQREDEDSIYYDVKVPDVEATTINTKVENGYITITGTIEKKTQSGDNNEENHFSENSFYSSTFNRTFPLPDHVDQKKMQISSEKDKIVLKFPKIKSS